ncbi:MAG: hypothetical protein GC137_02795 [Alphaproteobacteria bacterium]|nr:hypothetical protein [Alphaproteobacteria bacterium]
MSNEKSQKLLNPDFVGLEYIKRLFDAYKQQGLKAAFEAAVRVPAFSPVVEHYLSDNGGPSGDLAETEIRAKRANLQTALTSLSGQAPPRLEYYNTPPQDWRAGAFDLAQLARTSDIGAGNVYFLNCAPRRKERGVETGSNKGENIYTTILPNGAVVAATHQDSFGFFRDLLERGEIEIYHSNVQTDGTQFRSRDIFPAATAVASYALARAGERGEWKEGLSVQERREFLAQNLRFVDTKNRLSVEDVPDLTADVYVARVDVHGNLKLSIPVSDARAKGIQGDVEVRIQGHQFQAKVRPNMFDNNTKDQGVAPGSSGKFNDSVKSDPRFLEIAIMGKSLKAALGITDQDLKEGVQVYIEPRASNQNDPAAEAAVEAVSPSTGERSLA